MYIHTLSHLYNIHAKTTADNAIHQFAHPISTSHIATSHRDGGANANKERARVGRARTERQEDELSEEDSVEKLENEVVEGEREDDEEREEPQLVHNGSDEDTSRDEVNDALQLCLSLLEEGVLSADAWQFSVDGLAFHHWLFLHDDFFSLFCALFEREMIAFTDEEISLLVRHALDVDISLGDEYTIDGDPLLLWLSRQRHCSARQSILYIAGRAGYLQNWTICDEEGRTAMHLAAMQNDVSLLRLFVLLDVVPACFYFEAKDGEHRSCYERACDAKHAEVKTFLLEHQLLQCPFLE